MSTRKLDLEIWIIGPQSGATRFLGEVTLGGHRIFSWSGDPDLYFSEADAEYDLMLAFTDRLAEVLAE